MVACANVLAGLHRLTDPWPPSHHREAERISSPETLPGTRLSASLGLLQLPEQPDRTDLLLLDDQLLERRPGRQRIQGGGGEDRLQLRQVGGRRLDRKRLDPVTHQVGDHDGGLLHVARQLQEGGHVVPPGLPVALLELVSRVQGGQATQGQALREIREAKEDAVLVIQAPVAVRQLRPAVQVDPAHPGAVDQLQGRGIEGDFLPVLEEFLLALVEDRQEGEGLPVLHRRVRPEVRREGRRGGGREQGQGQQERREIPESHQSSPSKACRVASDRVNAQIGTGSGRGSGAAPACLSSRAPSSSGERARARS